jgi:branched-chain amino acid transport system ATP-binding protein
MRPPAAATADPLLAVRHLTAGYGPIEVLRDVSFDVRANEVLAIIGPNGAGKSTFLRALSGLVPASAGSISFGGTELVGRGSADIVRLGICHAPEGRRLFAGLTVEENLRLGSFKRPDKSRTVVAHAMERVFDYFPRLRERRRQLAGTMSGGEQQMCAIGRALMGSPRLLAIDELSLGLAPVIVEEIVMILQDIHAAGTTILLIEQDASVALGVSDRAIVMRGGQVVAEADAETLLNDQSLIKTYLGG